MIVHAETLEVGQVRRGMRVWIGGEWRTVTGILVGDKRVTMRLDYQPWPSMDARRFVRVWWQS